LKLPHLIDRVHKAFPGIDHPAFPAFTGYADSKVSLSRISVSQPQTGQYLTGKTLSAETEKNRSQPGQ
jgi:hypothetical protein